MGLLYAGCGVVLQVLLHPLANIGDSICTCYLYLDLWEASRNPTISIDIKSVLVNYLNLFFTVVIAYLYLYLYCAPRASFITPALHHIAGLTFIECTVALHFCVHGWVSTLCGCLHFLCRNIGDSSLAERYYVFDP